MPKTFTKMNDFFSALAIFSGSVVIAIMGLWTGFWFIDAYREYEQKNVDAARKAHVEQIKLGCKHLQKAVELDFGECLNDVFGK